MHGLHLRLGQFADHRRHPADGGRYGFGQSDLRRCGSSGRAQPQQLAVEDRIARIRSDWVNSPTIAAIRLMVGDTDSGNPIFDDAEVQGALNLNSSQSKIGLPESDLTGSIRRPSPPSG